MQNRNPNYSNTENENRNWRPQSERGTERDYQSNFQPNNQFGGTTNPDRGTPNDPNYSPSGYRPNERGSSNPDRDTYGRSGMSARDRDYGSDRMNAQGYDQNQSYGRNQSYDQNQDYNQNRHFSQSYGYDRDFDSNRSFGSNRNSGRDFGTHYGKGPKNYRRSDERVREDVQDCLWRHGDIDASEIDVDVKDGIVTLSGSIESRSARRAAEEAIENLPGVQDVKLDLQIQKSSDADLGSKFGSKETKTDGKSKSSSSTEKSKMM